MNTRSQGPTPAPDRPWMPLASEMRLLAAIAAQGPLRRRAPAADQESTLDFILWQWEVDSAHVPAGSRGSEQLERDFELRKWATDLLGSASGDRPWPVLTVQAVADGDGIRLQLALGRLDARTAPREVDLSLPACPDQVVTLVSDGDPDLPVLTGSVLAHLPDDGLAHMPCPVVAAVRR